MRIRLSDRTVYAILALLTVAIRLPFLRYFHFVSFDGTFYLNQAKALLHGSLSGGAFPIGYPLLVAPFIAVTRDPVVAGMVVSVLAAVGSVLLLYRLAQRFGARVDAFIAAAVLAITPLFIQTSLLTLSESAYVFWIMLTLALFGAGRFALAGLAVGMAAATRPEALAVAGVLGMVLVVKWIRVCSFKPRSLWRYAACFLAVYALNVVAMSVPRGGVTLLSRGGALESKATPWMLRETTLEWEGKKQEEAAMRQRVGSLDRTREYFTRLPGDLIDLFKQTLPVIPLLALFARRRSYVLAAFVPILFIPLFTERTGVLRWMAAYLPPLILYAVMGLARIERPQWRALARAAVVLAAVFGFMLNRDVLRAGIEDEMRPVQKIARDFAPRVKPDDRIADRKPYFAFYAGGIYREIPIAPYDDVMANLAEHDVRYLSLFQPSIHNLRPAMRPLLYDLAAIRGELRYRQVLFDRSGQIVYQRALDRDPLSEQPFNDDDAVTLTPAWSPDGTRVAFRRFADGNGELCVMDAGGGNVRTVLDAGRVADFLAWSPDGKRIALSLVEDGNQDIVVVNAAGGGAERITRDAARDYAPSWCRETGEIAFGSDRGGAPGVWVMERPGAAPRKISGDELAGPPSLSPDGGTIAWLDAVGRLVLMDRASGQRVTVAEPRGILAPASWNADGSVVAVAAYDWGAAQIYLIRVDDGRALRLTRGDTGRSMPSWHPDGSRIAVVAGERNDVSLVVLGELQPYLGRLYQEEPINAFRRGDDTRGGPPEAGR